MCLGNISYAKVCRQGRCMSLAVANPSQWFYKMVSSGWFPLKTCSAPSGINFHRKSLFLKLEAEFSFWRHPYYQHSEGWPVCVPNGGGFKNPASAFDEPSGVRSLKILDYPMPKKSELIRCLCRKESDLIRFRCRKKSELIRCRKNPIPKIIRINPMPKKSDSENNPN